MVPHTKSLMFRKMSTKDTIVEKTEGRLDERVIISVFEIWRSEIEKIKIQTYFLLILML